MAVATVPRENIAPSAQSMDMSPSTNSSDGTAAKEQPSPADGSSSTGGADPSDNSSASPSPSRQLEIQRSLRSEEYRQLFRLPPEEVLIQDFNCALQENFILQGHMYLFVHYICFYSNLFGFETKKVIHFNEVTSVKRTKTAAIFPTAIELIASEKKYNFTSFLSRDEAFKLINDGWLEHGNGAKAISDQQESRPELNDEDSEIVLVEDSNGTQLPGDELEVADRSRNDIVSEASKSSLSGEAEVLLTSSRVQDVVDEDSVLVQTTDCSSSGKTLVWSVEDSDAPDVPECYTQAAESKFPIKIDEFFNLFFSDDALPFLESYHKKCGDKDLKCTSWKPHDQLGHAREVSFQHPIKIYFGARFGGCNEVQSFRVYRNSHLVLKTSQEVSDVPYADYFSVEGLWDVIPDGSEPNGGCILRIYVNVAFSKKTMWKGKIVQSTIEECRDTFAAWIELAHGLLKEKDIGKEANLIRDTEINKEAQVEALDNSEVSRAESELMKSETLPTSTVVNHVRISEQTNSNSAGRIASLFGDSMPKLFSSLKFQSHVPFFVVIILAVVILLMQISIVVLLLRPPAIQVVSETAWMGNTHIDRRGETVALLDKQINNLKEEMLLVETLLEKMKHEHEMLTMQLKNFMLRKN